MEQCGLLSTVPDEQCQISCMAKGRPGTCKATSSLAGLFATPVHKPANTPCTLPAASAEPSSSSSSGFCNDVGQCLAYTYDTAGVVGAGVKSAGWVVGLVIFLVCYVIMTVVAVWIYCKYCRGQRNVTVEVREKGGSSGGGGSRKTSEEEEGES